VNALQEFKIQTSTYGPEFGRMPGGQVSIVTRSGSKDFHGTLFEYFRNDVLDSTDCSLKPMQHRRRLSDRMISAASAAQYFSLGLERWIYQLPGYVQDTWKVTPRLGLTYGLCWEVKAHSPKEMGTILSETQVDNLTMLEF